MPMAPLIIYNQLDCPRIENRIKVAPLCRWYMVQEFELAHRVLQALQPSEYYP